VKCNVHYTKIGGKIKRGTLGTLGTIGDYWDVRDGWDIEGGEGGKILRGSANGSINHKIENFMILQCRKIRRI